MKKKLLSVFLAIVVLAVSISVVSGVFTASASGTYDVIPAMPSVTPKFNIYEGAALQGTFGSTGISGQGHLPGYSPNPAQKTFAAGSTDGYGCFEFDFYLDNTSIIAARNTKLYLNLRSGTGSGTSRGLYEFQNQLTENGWNHIRVITKLGDDILEIITMARFYIDIDAGSTGAADRYRIANIFATVDPYNTVPAMVEASPRFDIQDGVLFSSTLGSTAKTGQAHPIGYSSGTPAEKSFTNSGLSSNYGFFEFDFYVDNYTNFAARSAKMYFSLRKSNGDAIATAFEFTDQITASGWNHIKVAADVTDEDLDNTGRVRFFTDIDAGSTGASDRYSVANICATHDECRFIPSMVEADFRYVMSDGNTFRGTIGSDKKDTDNPYPYSPNAAIKTFTQTTLSDYANIEFDFYIESYANFTARNTNFEFRLRNSSTGNRGKYKFGGQITKDGWNHIKISRYSLELDGGSAPDDGDINQAVDFRLYITVNAGDTGAADRYRMANVCATKRAKVETYSLVLDDSIGVNFFMDLSDLTVAEKAASYMTFAVTNGTAKTAVFNAEFTGTGGTYGFTCPLSSVQMAETVTPTFHYTSGGSEKTVTGSGHSVEDYIDYVNGHTSEYTAEVITLVNAIGNYGYYAQQYLSGKTTFTALSSSYGDLTSNATVQTNTNDKAINKGTASSKCTFTLNYDSSTNILLKFNTANVTFSSVTMGGQAYTDRKNKYTDSDCTLHLYRIPVLKLGDTITVVGTADGSAFTIQVSGLSYVNAASGSAKAALKNIACAMYDYYAAAVAYAAS